MIINSEYRVLNDNIKSNKIFSSKESFFAERTKTQMMLKFILNHYILKGRSVHTSR